MSTRSGQYVLQPQGYKAFIPKSLPPDPPIDFDEGFLELLSTADRALARLDGSIQTLPNPDLFVFMYIRREAVLSSQIEGTQASLQDVVEAEARLFDPDRPDDVGQVLNYIDAMNYGLERLTALPMSTRLIGDIHRRLLSGVRGQDQRPGEIRQKQNWIGPDNCLLADATFVPPPHTEVARCLSDLEKFLHSDIPMPPLIKIGLAHAQFETIHPFADGNGRVGRLLITLLLCEKQILQTPILYLSVFFKANRTRYYELLQATRDEGNWEAWLTFFLRGVAETSRAATSTARDIVALREAHRHVILDRFGRTAGNGIALLENLFQTPVVTVNQVTEKLALSYSSANDLVSRFVDARLLEEGTGQSRNRKFFYRPYIRLFSDL